jgi:predicted nucleic acid-binding protein
VTVVSDSSPLVILTKLGYFDLLNRLFSRVYISAEVHDEVVVVGTGLPGAAEISNAKWIEVKQLQNPASLLAAQQKQALGLGEISTIPCGQETRRGPSPPEQSRFLFLINVSVSAAFN